MDEYWTQVDTVTKAVREAHSQDEVIAALNTVAERSSGDAFYQGDGDDLLDALTDGGWRVTWLDASYYWVVQNAAREFITYVEGDVYRGDTHVDNDDD